MFLGSAIFLAAFVILLGLANLGVNFRYMNVLAGLLGITTGVLLLLGL